MKLRKDKQRDRRLKALDNLHKQIVMLNKQIELKDTRKVGDNMENLKAKITKKEEEMEILKKRLGFD